MKKSVLKIAAMAVLAFAGVAVSQAQPICADCGLVADRPVVNLSTLADVDGNFTATNTVLNCQNLYKLDKRLYVTDGKSLTIPAGTIIKADTGSVANAKSLVISQGGKIFAEGTKECPIIFTSVSDPLDGTKPLCDRLEWGGVIILGKAQNNLKAGDGGTFAEGVGYIEGLPIPDARHHYGRYNGQFDDHDNSGVIRYVSLRYGGAIIGLANEINGFTLGSVGDQTVIDHVEVAATQDDGFEFFGGTVNVKYCVTVGMGDDGFDWDQNYQGKGQFLYALWLPGTLVPSQENGSCGLEIDGNDKDGRLPNSYGRFYNVTAIGNSTAPNAAIEAKAETRGEIVNSIFANYSSAGLRITKNKTALYYQQDSLEVKCNTFVNVPSSARIVPVNLNGWSQAQYEAEFDGDGNVVVASLAGFDAVWDNTPPSCVFTGKVDQVPDAAATTCPKPLDDFFEYAPYRGAFNPIEEPWTKGWTYYSNLGTGVQDVLCPTDLDGNGVTEVADYLQVVGAFGTSCQ